VTPTQARKIALSFPGTEERLSYGTPCIFIGKKVFVRIGTREANTIQMNTESFEERDHLIAADPETFFITDHFKNYKAALARTAKLDAKTLEVFLERRWRTIAPKVLLKAAEAKR
jgi:hypothetical protein